MGGFSYRLDSVRGNRKPRKIGSLQKKGQPKLPCCRRLTDNRYCGAGCVLSVCVVGLSVTGLGVMCECDVGTARDAAAGFIGECELGRLSDAACSPLPCFFASPGGMQPLLPGVQPHPVLLP